MRRLLACLALATALAPACSANQATSNVGTIDEPAQQACSALQAVIQARASGQLGPRELQAQIAQVYGLASTSTNPLLRARAVAVFADATQLVTAGESGSLDADLAAMSQACAPAGT
jgi:hypothetical protein